MGSPQSMAFTPVGNTAAITAATTAPDGVQVLPGAMGNEPAVGGTPVQFRVYNSGTVVVFMGWSQASAAAANTNANTAPSSGSPAFPPAVPPGSVEVWTLPRNAYISFKAASSTATVYVTPGRGT